MDEWEVAGGDDGIFLCHHFRSLLREELIVRDDRVVGFTCANSQLLQLEGLVADTQHTIAYIRGGLSPDVTDWTYAVGRERTKFYGPLETRDQMPVAHDHNGAALFMPTPCFWVHYGRVDSLRHALEDAWSELRKSGHPS